MVYFKQFIEVKVIKISEYKNEQFERDQLLMGKNLTVFPLKKME